MLLNHRFVDDSVRIVCFSDTRAQPSGFIFNCAPDDGRSSECCHRHKKLGAMQAGICILTRPSSTVCLS